MVQEKRIIKSLYTIRFLLFILIFLRHTIGLVKMEWLAQSGLAVTGFIILSGFLNGYMYNSKYDKITIKNIIDFVYKRIKKLYPLHIITLLIAIGMYPPFNEFIFHQIEYIKIFLMNLFLIQTWVNDSNYYFSFNGVSWFLSTYLFLTIITVPILYVIGKINKKKYSAIIFAVFIVIIYSALLLLTHYIQIKGLNSEFWINVFPPSRALEYTIGILSGCIISKIKINFKYDKIVFTFAELFSLILICVFVKYVPLNTWLTYWGSKWVVPLVLIFSIFIYEKGYISKLFGIKLLVMIGSSTMVMYFIHSELIYYIVHATGYTMHPRYLALYIFILSVLLGVIITNLMNNKKKDKC
ncbi:MAG: acyltransferase [Bacilli bacterium]|nr:acyltransferase [Bacilli bacterium]